MPDLSFPLAPQNTSSVVNSISTMAPATSPVIVQFGDSRCGGGNYSVAGSSVTLNGTTATIVANNHNLQTGLPCFIDGCAVGGTYDTTGLLNGAQVVASRVDANTFTINCTLTGAVTASPNIFVVNDLRINDRNCMALAIARLGQDSVIINRGCSGQGTGNMLARVQRDIANCKIGTVRYTPNIVFLRSPGINDINSGVAIATIQSNISGIITQLKALSFKPLIIISTCLPVSSSNGAYTVARRDTRLVLNEWIRATFRAMPGVLVFDEHAIAVDTTGAQASAAGWIAAYTYDGLHDNATFDVTASSTLATLISPYFPGGSAYSVDSTQDTYATSSSALQLLGNPLFTGNTGTVGTGGAGTAADGLQLGRLGGATFTATAGVTRTDGVGYDQKIAIVAAANNDGVFTIFDYPNLVQGKTYRLKTHVKATGTVSLSQINVFCDLYDGSVDTYVSGMEPNGQSGNWPDGNYDMIFTSPPFTIAALTLSSPYARADIKQGGAGGDATHNLYYFGRTSVNIIS